MKHLSGALLALTVAPIAAVLSQPLPASAATLATCAATQAVLSGQGGSANSGGSSTLSGSSQQRICVSTATPGGPSGRKSSDPGSVTDYLRAGSGPDLAAETGSDIRLGTPRSGASEDPASDRDRELLPPPADASGPATPGCIEALAAGPDPTDASTGADLAPQDEVTTDNANAACESSKSVFTDPHHFNPATPAGQRTESTDRGAQADSDTSTLPYTGATAATALTLGLGASGGGLLLIAGSMRRRRTTS